MRPPKLTYRDETDRPWSSLDGQTSFVPHNTPKVPAISSTSFFGQIRSDRFIDATSAAVPQNS
jgi:hypothetical protein